MTWNISTHLWKEWREQRAALLQLGLLVGIGYALAALLLPTSLRADPILRHVAALIPLVVVCGTVVPDLLSRERRGGGIEFLARTPGGLRDAWIAKCLFASLLVAGAILAGEFAASALGAPLASSPQPAWTPTTDAASLSILVALVAWTFAVSAWLSNGLLALPCAVILTVATLAPAVAMSSGVDRARPDVHFLALMPLGAAIGLLGSWLAFVSGPRRGRSKRWIASVGVATCALGLVPSAMPATLRAVFPPREVALEPVALTDDGVFLFHHVSRSGSPSTDDRVTLVTVDLATRAVREDADRLAVTRVPWVRHDNPFVLRGLEPVVVETANLRSSLAMIESDPVPAGHPVPADFGRADVTDRFYVACEGAGHSLSVFRGQSEQRHFRDRHGARCISLEDLDALTPELTVEGAVIATADVWLVRDARRAWWWLDLRTGDTEPCGALARDSRSGWSFGPATTSGSLIVADDGGLKLLDARTRSVRRVATDRPVLGISHVPDDHACTVLDDDAVVWLSVYVGETNDDRRQAALLLDAAKAEAVDLVVLDDPRACVLAANDDGVLYQPRWGGDVTWFHRASRESRTLVVADR